MQITREQHWLPRYRLRRFLDDDKKFDVFDTYTLMRSRKGVNMRGLGSAENLYEHEGLSVNLIETDLFARDAEVVDSCWLNDFLIRFDILSCISESDSNWLSDYAIRMLLRHPDAIEIIKSIYNNSADYLHFIELCQKVGHFSDLTVCEQNDIRNKIRFSFLTTHSTCIVAQDSEFLLPDNGFTMYGSIYDGDVITNTLTYLTPKICIRSFDIHDYSNGYNEPGRIRIIPKSTVDNINKYICQHVVRYIIGRQISDETLTYLKQECLSMRR